MSGADRQAGNRFILKGLIAGLLLLGMTVIKTYPLILHLGTHIPSDPGDPLFVTWVLAWDFHALTTDPWNLFNANTFYPVENSLAFSEHMVGVMPTFAPAYAMTRNPIFAYNIAFLLSFVLSGVAMFLLIYYWTASFWASLVSSVLFAFAPIRFAQISHLQLLNLYWAPLTLLFLDRFLRSKRWGDLICASIFYWLQVLSSVYLGWFITIAIVLYAVHFVRFINKEVLSRSVAIKLATFAGSSLVVLLPFHLPYYAANRQWGFSFSVSDCVFYSADLLLSFVTVPPLMNDLYRTLFRFAWELGRPHEKWLFPGLVLPLLIGFGSLRMKGFSLSDRLTQMRRLFWLLLISFFVLSLGPFLVALNRNTHIPLPYLILYHGIPGFKSMRVPARFDLMIVLAGSVLAAVGFLKACTYLDAQARPGRRDFPTRHAVLAASIVGVFALELGFKPLPLAKVQTGREVPEVYRWLAGKNLTGPIVEFPINTMETFQFTYFSTYHWLPIVSGYSSFVPPTYPQIIHELQALPSRKAVEYLGAIGVKGLVLHTRRLSPDKALEWRGPGIAEMGLERVAEFGPDVVYKIPPVDSTHQLALVSVGSDAVAAGPNAKIELLAQGVGHRTWTHPRPLGLTSAIVEWKAQGTEETLIRRERVGLPLVIRAGEVSRIILSVGTPPSPGHYSLRLHFPSFDISTVPRVVKLTPAPLPTSLTSPKLLSATYTLEGEPPHSVTSGPITVSLRATNTGQAVWLARAEGGRGAVLLGWDWYKGKREAFVSAGRERLAHDVYPGQSYEFKVKIDTPQDTGDYTLELGLVSEHVTWFFDQGVKPLRFNVRFVQARVPSGRGPEP